MMRATFPKEVILEDKRKRLVLATIAGVLAGVACGGQQPEASAPSGAAGSPSAQSDGGVNKAMHGCGMHDGGSCGTPDEHKH